MKIKLAYIGYPACIPKILKKIKEAQTPDRFTYDFLETVLGFKGGNYQQFVSLAKKIGLLATGGEPTDLYKKFRNAKTSEAAMANAIKTGYPEIFEKNEYANKLSKDDLKGLVVEITGLDSKNRIVQMICQTFQYLKEFSDFETKMPQENAGEENQDKKNPPDGQDDKPKNTKLNLAYNINLVLPKTDDPAVFNAIFRSLKEHLMKE